MILVFGSNEGGIHGAGAAAFAYKKRGARWGFSYGHMGDSFAIPTKDDQIQTMPLSRIEDYVKGFLAFARGHPKLTFKVTQIGCGLAGLKPADIAPMFKLAPKNCKFDKAWKPWLGEDFAYWGTFP